jgi:hypothetical protein
MASLERVFDPHATEPAQDRIPGRDLALAALATLAALNREAFAATCADMDGARERLALAALRAGRTLRAGVGA